MAVIQLSKPDESDAISSKLRIGHEKFGRSTVLNVTGLCSRAKKTDGRFSAYTFPWS